MINNIHIWTVQWVVADKEQKYIPKVEIHKTYKSAMARINELVDFTSDIDVSKNDIPKERISGLSMSEFII